jgi:hypothetical protein
MRSHHAAYRAMHDAPGWERQAVEIWRVACEVSMKRREMTQQMMRLNCCSARQ